MTKKTLFALSLLCGGLFSAQALADVRLPQWVEDGMVLQRGTEIPVWGYADPGEKVSVTFRKRTYRTRAGDEGRWDIKLPKQKAGGPYTLKVKGNNELLLEDILIGDVWLSSGQSNMELTMARVKPLYREEMAQAHQPEIRYFDVPDRYHFQKPLEDLESGEWVKITPETIPSVSAVAYFFARDVHAATDVPIGIVNAALGGSPVEAWISEDELKAFPQHYKEAQRFKDRAMVEEIIESDSKRISAWHETAAEKDVGLKDGEPVWTKDFNTEDWRQMDVPGYWDETEEGPLNGILWFRKTFELPEALAGKAAKLELGRVVDADTTYINGVEVGSTTYQYPPRRYEVPSGVLEAGTNTLTVRVTSERGRGGFFLDKPYELNVAGETIDLTGQWRYRLGAQMPPLEPQTFVRWKPLGLYNGMIAPLETMPIKGVIWYQGESNAGRAHEYHPLFSTMIEDWRQQRGQPELPFLYVQLPNFMEAQSEPTESDWARLREAQLETLSVPNTAMAVAIDVGEWNDIHPLNKETVGERLALAARHQVYGQEVIPSGPIYRSMKVEGNKIILSFDHVDGGLVAKEGPLQEFAIAGSDQQFVWAQAEIKGDKIVVQSDQVSNPVAVRYAWADNPDDANLYNEAGLPASPFRTDDW